jgi:hypothetical protein
MKVGWRFWSTRRSTHGISNIAWKEGECAAHIGMPSGRFFPFFFRIYTRRAGSHWYRSYRRASMRVSIFFSDMPSGVSSVTPCVMAPVLR